jgi:hypothetical protein
MKVVAAESLQHELLGIALRNVLDGVDVEIRVQGTSRIGCSTSNWLIPDNCGDGRAMGAHQAASPERSAAPGRSHACSEGHHTRYGPDGSLVGLTIVNARWLLDQDGEIVLTLPEQKVRATDLDDVLAAA